MLCDTTTMIGKSLYQSSKVYVKHELIYMFLKLKNKKLVVCITPLLTNSSYTSINYAELLTLMINKQKDPNAMVENKILSAMHKC